MLNILSENTIIFPGVTLFNHIIKDVGDVGAGLTLSYNLDSYSFITVVKPNRSHAGSMWLPEIIELVLI